MTPVSTYFPRLRYPVNGVLICGIAVLWIAIAGSVVSP
jgi:hypothetical protein